MSVQSAYDQWSQTYDDDPNVTKDLDQRITAATLDRFGGRVALELGCGTGKNTPFLADRFKSVCAVDFSTGMLSRARERVAATNVTFLQADVLQRWPCEDHTVDLVTINLVLEHVADLMLVFNEAARVLRPGGHLFVCELHPFRQYLGSQARFERQGETVRIPAYTHHVSDFLAGASAAQLALLGLREWWLSENLEEPPRLLSLLFERSA
jgi:ubiquinone/menaquinone biosynthesis C-methylase UbiE